MQYQSYILRIYLGPIPFQSLSLLTTVNWGATSTLLQTKNGGFRDSGGPELRLNPNTYHSKLVLSLFEYSPTKTPLHESEGLFLDNRGI
jgi:hypothetical protein